MVANAPWGSAGRGEAAYEGARLPVRQAPGGPHNDEELYGLARGHVDRDHREMQLSDEQVQGIVARGAYDK